MTEHQKAPQIGRAFAYLFSPPGAVTIFCFHPSPLSIGSLNLFKHTVTWINANRELGHKRLELMNCSASSTNH
ncbi:hypothetical protein [Prochlorococcus marinus]|uniref:hypothetical protein n=1 Tax=Prochlorococcus marinus TaxID=1219 RepID=UPI001F2D9FE0|nr:hypothetical protein [Prochlorococcus marinus]